MEKQGLEAQGKIGRGKSIPQPQPQPQEIIIIAIIIIITTTMITIVVMAVIVVIGESINENRIKQTIMGMERRASTWAERKKNIRKRKRKE
ncbi:hypothetical protein BO83DRAFT_92565 [Aspergillus eucalypticola CBS 122712]|uniref:Uncharacterized protein n=1 Tax=Aspergillus eucalypticola (strain CBS 122712 / IBT 29274) TaxID=1448314 RepID=A0A317V6A0_ASPEC|nr:uncharacterized protein BO83DRAFT_92565 [Aspergillus eucalypticola CBS 122712]PWY67670.1 hypothetical protein BO83DRAFT_92565 [Aspergillus eucalypticola CBS 122712]